MLSEVHWNRWCDFRRTEYILNSVSKSL